MQEISAEQGRALARYARKIVAEHLGVALTEQSDDDALLQHPVFNEKRGTFVTLKTRGNDLRGCIGSLAASESIREGVRRNALNAAFNDPRFEPVNKEEFPDLSFEISLLTEPAPLVYSDTEDLVAKLRPGVDGVILRKGARSATFLPQVWDQLPRTEDFLSHLCSKAFLPADSWRTEKLEIMTYQVQHFEDD